MEPSVGAGALAPPPPPEQPASRAVAPRVAAERVSERAVARGTVDLLDDRGNAGGQAVAEAVDALRARPGSRNSVSTMPTYNTQTIASTTVVWGERLKMPLSSVPCQESAGTIALMSNASVFSPGRMLASCRSCMP